MQAIFAGLLVTALCLCAQEQETQIKEIRGLPPRATPADYQAHGQAGSMTIAAEFAGHFVPTLQGNLTTEDYVVVETGMFGPPEAHIKLFLGDFSLRINGKKTASPAQPYGMVIKSLKDPDWEPPEVADSSSSSSKTKIITGGAGVSGSGSGRDKDPLAAPVRIPVEVQRAMEQRVQKASLPEGDRTVPVAGLIFFRYSGGTNGIHSIELIYNGSAGNVTLELRP
jgi:hypothetical protein